MTASRLRARLRRLRNSHDDGDGGELNLVPYLDIVTNIILFLFATMSFAASAAVVRTSAPAYGPGEGVDRSVAVHVSAAGITVATAAGSLPRDGEPGRFPTVGRAAEGYDLAALARVLRGLSATAPAGTTARISADPQVPYEDVIAVMDATREAGFAEQTLGTGAAVEAAH
jgi:biopolymer transport protein ExbD